MGRLIEAYLASGVDVPLVLVAGEGWHNESETTLLEEAAREASPDRQGSTERGSSGVCDDFAMSDPQP